MEIIYSVSVDGKHMITGCCSESCDKKDNCLRYRYRDEFTVVNDYYPYGSIYCDKYVEKTEL